MSAMARGGGAVQGRTGKEHVLPLSDSTLHEAQDEEAKMPTGTVKWFNPTKGYGFIEPEDKSKDVFVHISAVERAGLGTLTEGQRVEFDVSSGRDGRLSAENLRLAD